ncbi:hypothetical protein EVAR_22428_1 [Eumeta japonica]|uniref:Uncharacterized protein n=1 Tax=Eumeta variegata TaxID=151549 RepID=A0A4C1ZW84_EUMVA|nr:hypothetical protein EVAR_22428_1 [Eumeta japonica]
MAPKISNKILNRKKLLLKQTEQKKVRIKKIQKNYTEDMLNLAVDLVKKKKQISTYDVEKQFGANKANCEHTLQFALLAPNEWTVDEEKQNYKMSNRRS